MLIIKTAILYASKYGCTQKAAHLLAKKLPEDVSLCNVKKDKVPDLNEFGCIILGGSIYVGKIQKEIRDIVNNNKELLLNKKVGLYICCGLEDKAEIQLKESFPEEIYSHAVAKGYFGYEFNFDKMNFFERLAMKVVAKTTESESSLKIDNIDMFAEEIAVEKN